MQDFEGRGRKRNTTQRDDVRIIRLAENDPETSAKKIHLNMEGKGLEVSESTVRRRLNEGGLRYGPPLKKPLLKPNHLEARLQFVLENADRDWDRVIFTDESTFQLFQSARMVWQPIQLSGAEDGEAWTQGACLGWFFFKRLRQTRPLHPQFGCLLFDPNI